MIELIPQKPPFVLISSLLEVSDSLILAQRESDFPVTKAIYTLFERLGDGPGIASGQGHRR